jgi:DNA-binding HxlR family transcriptional regulator
MKTGYRQFCAAARTLDLVGQRWTLLVVRELALRGPLAAAAIARGLPDVPMNQLVQRLAELEAAGLVECSEDREWALTESGRSLEGVLGALADFGLSHLAGEGAERGDAILPHVLMRQLELRYDTAPAAAEGFTGRFDLDLTDPDAMWSVEPGVSAPGRFALHAGPDGLHAHAGACLEPDAELRLTVAACTRLVAGVPDVAAEIELSGDVARAARLLELLGVPRTEALALAA